MLDVGDLVEFQHCYFKKLGDTQPTFVYFIGLIVAKTPAYGEHRQVLTNSYEIRWINGGDEMVQTTFDEDYVHRSMTKINQHED